MATSGLQSIALTLLLISHESRLIAMRRHGKIIREVRNRDRAEWIAVHSSEWGAKWKAIVRVEKRRRRRRMGRNVNNAGITSVMSEECIYI